MTDSLLIVHTDKNIAEEKCEAFRRKGWHATAAQSVAEVCESMESLDFEPHVILVYLGDTKITPHDYENISAHCDTCEWIFIDQSPSTQHDDELASQAFDILDAPVSEKRLDTVVRRALRAAITTRRLESYSKAEIKKYQLAAFIGESDAVQHLKKMLQRLAEIPLSTMIITGETGTGKGLVARIIHHTGLRRNGPLVEINCAALPKDLMESELFGHEAGAFTGAKGRHHGLFEQARGGTLFMDEIGEMDFDLQAKLLKAIEDKQIRRLGGEKQIKVDCQIIAATGKDLAKAASEETFRSDLYHRLSVFCLELPPIRERKEDLTALVPQIIAEFNLKANKKVEVVPDEVWRRLYSYDWPGNVRELRNVLERSVLLSVDRVLPVEWLQLSCSPDSDASASCATLTADTIAIPLNGTMALDKMDQFIIESALKKSAYNITEAARFLGTTRETLRYRIQKYHIDTQKTSA